MCEDQSPAARRLALLAYKRGAPVGIRTRAEKQLGPPKSRARLRRVGRRRSEMAPAITGAQAAACRALPCYVCGAHGYPTNPVDPHHEPRVEDGGLDADTLPLCRRCHRRRHDVTAEAFWREAELSPRAAQAAVREWMALGCPAGVRWDYTRARAAFLGEQVTAGGREERAA